MTGESKDGFQRLKELAEHIFDNVSDGKTFLAKKQIRLLIANLDVLETEIELSDN